MAEPAGDIERQVEAAYEFRGHVTLTLKSGESHEGFLFNRQYRNPKLPQDRFVEIFPRDSDESRRFPIDDIESIDIPE